MLTSINVEDRSRHVVRLDLWFDGCPYSDIIYPRRSGRGEPSACPSACPYARVTQAFHPGYSQGHNLSGGDACCEVNKTTFKCRSCTSCRPLTSRSWSIAEPRSREKSHDMPGGPGVHPLDNHLSISFIPCLRKIASSHLSPCSRRVQIIHALPCRTRSSPGR